MQPEEGLRAAARRSGSAEARRAGAVGALRLDAEQRGKPGTVTRADPLARGARRLRPGRAAGVLEEDGGLRALARRTARSAISCSGASCARSSTTRLSTRGSSSASGRSRPGCSATMCGGSPRAVSSRVLTATSPRGSGIPTAARSSRARTRSRSAIPSSDGDPLVADVSMGAVTWGDVVAGLAPEDELVPFGGEQAHKAFALAVGLQLLVDALVREPGTARCCSSRGRRRSGPGAPRARRRRPAAGRFLVTTCY